MLQAFSDWAVAPRSTAWRWSIAALAWMVAFLLRYLLDDDFPPGFPYLTFFPAVILTTFLAGLWPGIAVALACGICAWYFFIPPVRSFGLGGSTALALGFYAFICATDIAILHVMRRALAQVQAERARSTELARQRELMFHELQHRVSNNLAAVASLLKMQRRQISDPPAQRALDDAVNRIAVVGRMQRMLHDPNVQMVDFGHFLREMTGELLETSGAGQRIQAEVRAEQVEIGPQQTIPLGLIATEFIANAIEHGFAGERQGRLTVALRAPESADGLAELVVEDDGAGLPAGFTLEATRSLGLLLARQFAQQLEAKIEMVQGTGHGTVSRLAFPLRPEAA